MSDGYRSDELELVIERAVQARCSDYAQPCNHDEVRQLADLAAQLVDDDRELGDRRGPMVAGQPASDRLMRSLDYRLFPGAAQLSAEQVAVVLHALADHTALMAAIQWRRDEDCPWPVARSLGRWFHDVGDQLERQVGRL